jgi:hypothetical protein
MLNWFTGIDAIEAEDGNFILNEECLQLLKLEKTVIDKKEIDLKSTLSSYPIKDKKDIIFKVYSEMDK